jgi:hypothetical protein
MWSLTRATADFEAAHDAPSEPAEPALTVARRVAHEVWHHVRDMVAGGRDPHSREPPVPS